MNLHVNWHLTVHHSRRYAKENNPWQWFTAEKRNHSFMLFNDGFRASSSFKFATFRYLQFVFSFSGFIYMDCTQIETSEVLIFPAVFKPFSSRQYQDHMLTFLYALFFVFLTLYKSFCQCVLQSHSNGAVFSDLILLQRAGMKCLQWQLKMQCCY